jgi:hypothetical protein
LTKFAEAILQVTCITNPTINSLTLADFFLKLPFGPSLTTSSIIHFTNDHAGHNYGGNGTVETDKLTIPAQQELPTNNSMAW